jgi:hypothetical protein
MRSVNPVKGVKHSGGFPTPPDDKNPLRPTLKTVWMEASMLSEFILWLKSNNWTVIEYDQRIGENLVNQIFPTSFSDSDYFTEFVCRVKRCVNESGTVWFNCYDEFSENSDIAFKWNEFELLSLESSEDDELLKQTIYKFWRCNLPIIMSVKNGYEYYAIRNDGMVVSGVEPEFEETRQISESFEKFTEMLVDKRIVL